MSIIYDLPKIGSAPPEGQKGGWKQKGPTCWYYSAKMIMKFHERYQKGTGNQELEDVYTQWKQLHELRKLMTGIEEKSVRSNPVLVKELLIKKRDAIVDYLKEIGPGDLQLLGFTSELKVLDQPNAKIRLERIDDLLKRIDQIAGDFKNRMEALQSITSNAGFCELSSKNVLESTATAEDVLRTFGPLYSSGALSLKEKPINNAPVLREGRLGNGDAVLAVYELEAESAHAVVMVGVSGDSLYYKDPNRSGGIMAIPFATFKEKVSENSKMIYLHCDVSRDHDEYRCIHNRTKVLDQSHPLLAHV